MPLTMREHEASLHHSALCELLPIRDYLDQCLVRTNGALVAGYELGGAHSYYHSDDMRNRMKNALETLVRSLPERSMRMKLSRAWGTFATATTASSEATTPFCKAWIACVLKPGRGKRMPAIT
jgi:hypothetical protein